MTLLSDLSPPKRALLDRLLRGDATAAVKDELTPRPAGIPIPLSAEQEHVWLHAAMTPDAPRYNEPITIHRRGPFDLARLEDSLNEVIRRHEIWRTGFESGPDGVVQRVWHNVRVHLMLIDLSNLPSPDREQVALRLASDEARQPFAMERPPLLRGSVIRFAEEEHRLYLTLHHIIFDGVSIYRIFLPLLAEIYDALSAGGNVSAIPTPRLQYADYALWRAERAQGVEMKHHLERWRGMLSGELPVFRLPADRLAPREPSHAGAMEVFRFPEGLTEQVRRTARSLFVTDYVLLLAAFQTILFRICGQGDILVGSVTDMRRRLALEDMMGYFLNSLPIRTRPRLDMTFADYARQTGDAVICALDACDVPFRDIVRALRPQRDTSANPLFDVVFSMEPPCSAFPKGWDLTQMDVTNGSAKFALYLELDERPDGLIGRLVYRTELFDATTVRRIVGHWLTLLASIVADPYAPIGRLQILAKQEQDQLAKWNDTARPLVDVRLETLIEAQCRRSPDAVAVSAGDGDLTYREMDRIATLIASDLRAAGVQAGMVVGLCVDRDTGLLPALLGILKVGAAYLPLDPALPGPRLALYVDEAKPDLVLTTPLLAARLPLGVATLVIVRDTRDRLGAAVDPCGGDGLAYVLLTSGTTGTPKAVEVMHRSLVNLVADMQSIVGFSADDSWLAVTTLSFDIAALELFLPLIAGGTVLLVDHETASDPHALAGLVAHARPTVMQATPTLWRALIAAGWSGHEGLRVLCGGEAMSRDLADGLLARADQVWNLYGPTETTIWSTCHRVGRSLRDIPIGRPIANTSVFVLDESGNRLPVGVAGELHIGGAGVARGYRHQIALTAQRFGVRSGTDGQRVYRTGDVVRLRPDGALMFLGRADEQVKIRGHRISLDEVAAALQSHPDIAAAAVVVATDASGDEFLSGYFVAVGEPPPGAALRKHLAQFLPGPMIPARFTSLPDLPRTLNGKLDRGALPRSLASNGGGEAGFQTAIERDIAALVEQVLGVSSISRDDDFFELGGHSLLAARVMAEVERRFGRRMPLSSFFRTPTVGGVVAFLAQDSTDVRHAGPTSPDREVMLAFESLGEDCEFGLVQRRYRAEPFGLLRFTSLSIDSVARGLDDDFRDIDDLSCLQAEGSGEGCIVTNIRYGSSYTLPQPSGRAGRALLAAEAEKLRILRSMFLRNLASGDRICVVKARHDPSTDQVRRLQDALRRHGPTALLWVRRADDEHPPGSVELAERSLLVGWIDRFAPAADPGDASAMWLPLCTKALRLWHASRSMTP